MKLLRASVIIPTHDRPERLGALLGDLLRDSSESDGPFEVLVVDSPGAASALPAVEYYVSRGLNVRLLLAKSNNLAAKRNEGATAALAPILIFLDDDMRLSASAFVMTHVNAHRELPRRLVSGAVGFPDAWIRESGLYRYKSGRQLGSNTTDGMVSPAGFVAMNCSLRRDVFLDIGGYDETFVAYGGEDLEFAFRASRAGVSLGFDPTARALHVETRLDTRGYARKMYDFGYYGVPRVLERAPEAREVNTIAIVAKLRGAPLPVTILSKGIYALARWRFPVQALILGIEWTSSRSIPLPGGYRMVAALSVAAGYSDSTSGSEPHWPSTWGTGSGG